MNMDNYFDPADLRRLIRRQRGPVRAYARLALAWHARKGVMLSPDEIHHLLTQDCAITDALTTAIEKMDE